MGKYLTSPSLCLIIREKTREVLMVSLNIALHEGIRRPEGHTDDDEIVQATNLWFDAEVSPELLLEIIEGGMEAMSDLFETCYHDATRYYRIWDNYSPGEHWEDVTDLESEFSPETPLYHCEWHADVDWNKGKWFSLLGSTFGEEMASDELVAYLKSLTDN